MDGEKGEPVRTDVVVIGGGGAGLAAAIEAATRGCAVLLLEKNAALGGSTSWSVGSISATRTPHQLARGIQDSPQEHFEDLEILAGGYAERDNRELRRVLVDRMTETIAWLMDLGVVFVGPNPEPPHRHPRMHNVVPNSKSFAYHLEGRGRRLGVDIRLRTAAERLLRRDGEVAGVVARRADGRIVEVHAKGGVILAAGDYSASPELKRRYASAEVADLEPVNGTATGDGFRLGLAEGAVMVNGDIVRGPVIRFVPPPSPSWIERLPPVWPLARGMKWSYDHLPERLLRPFAMRFLTTALGPSGDLFREGAILINRDGHRGNELEKPGYAVPRQPDRVAYILFDRTVAAKFQAWPFFISTAPGVAYAYLEDYRRNRPDIFHCGRNLAELAGTLGIGLDALASTIESYNAVERHSRSVGGRASPALVQGPFYALGPVRSYVVFTDGGLKVDRSMRVLDQGGVVIPGLYAAGSNGQGGLLLEGHGHHLGWAFTSGRIAGRTAAEDALRGRSSAATPTQLEHDRRREA